MVAAKFSRVYLDILAMFLPSLENLSPSQISLDALVFFFYGNRPPDVKKRHDGSDIVVSTWTRAFKTDYRGNSSLWKSFF